MHQDSEDRETEEIMEAEDDMALLEEIFRLKD